MRFSDRDDAWGDLYRTMEKAFEEPSDSSSGQSDLPSCLNCYNHGCSRGCPHHGRDYVGRHYKCKFHND